ncbi:hypothetical protein TRFO_09712 [Tritrichomonas foetus]|uniref:Glycosyltransferase RgtA/B/C/D-like domain-containing protein n=1 Tax=Tritrichomonas foetus TaxID=1144522 RepID=A0A1J4JC96_9EUKA|nr:hypothetical protein TRFO_09712 [Tritrichomonas foetus]|eukprot:OHS96826.1 hypothetical protein TRFO_09712 [Tritrichomonas foetus]
MIWIATLLGQIFLGFEFSFFAFAEKFDILTIFALGIPIGFSISSLFFYLISIFLRFNSLHLLIHTVGLFLSGYVFEFFRWKKKQRLFSKQVFSELLNKQTIFFLVVSILVPLFIVPKMYFPQPGFAHSAFTGDIPEEISLMNSFYHGCNSGFMNIFKIRHPVCYKCHARSRWLTAFHSAMFLVGYSSERNALIVPSFFMIMTICILMLRFSNYFLKSPFLSFCSLLLFFCASGFGFTWWLEREPRLNPKIDFVFNFGPIQTEWSHPLFHYIFALRPSQLSLCLVLSILLVLTTHSSKNMLGQWEMIFLGICTGILPAVQHQVFICAIIYLLSYFLLTYPYHQLQSRQFSQISTFEKAKHYITFLVTFGVVSFFPLIHYLPRANRTSMIIRDDFWQPLASRGMYFAPIQCWYYALGFFPFFTLIVSWFIINKKLLRFYLPSIFVFIFANYYRFDSYGRHNIIVFYPFWISIASIVFIYTMRGLSRIPKSEEAQGVIIGLAGFLFLCNIWSTVLSYYRMRNLSTIVFTSEMVEMAKFICENTPKKAVFISSDDDFDTVAVLAGKVSYIHSSRFMWLDGFHPIQKDDDIYNFLENPQSTSIPKIKYVLNYENQNNKRRILEKWDQGNWTQIFYRGNYSLYQRNN